LQGGGALKVKTAEFIVGAASLRQLPRDGLLEIALAGRSNVGKSSLLNRLTERKGLARISRTPGKTRELNLYRIDGKFVIVDLPGYGFANVPESVKERWSALIESYLHERKELQGIVHLVDARHPPSKDDVQMHEWIKHFGLTALIAVTKADKLPKDRRPAALRVIGELLEPAAETPIVLFSAVTGEGADALWGWIRRVAQAERRVA
jgi:GTP-binding protein